MTPPSPPFHNISGVPNFRDLGGYPLSQSSSIRRHLVYRSGEPSLVTPEGITAVQRLGITHVYDLRSNNEIERAKAAGRGDVVGWEGCERVFVPVFTDQDYSPQNLAVRYKDYASEGSEGFTRAYTDILTSGTTAYRKILLHLAHSPDKPLLVHCTAGKDRTGVLCALLLSVCGVSDDDVAAEYALTEQGMPEHWKQGVLAHLMQNPALEGNRKGAENMISAKAENILATLRMIREKFGGPEQYMIEKCGLSKEEVEQIRRNLTVEEPAIHKQNL